MKYYFKLILFYIQQYILATIASVIDPRGWAMATKSICAVCPEYPIWTYYSVMYIMVCCDISRNFSTNTIVQHRC